MRHREFIFFVLFSSRTLSRRQKILVFVSLFSTSLNSVKYAPHDCMSPSPISTSCVTHTLRSQNTRNNDLQRKNYCPIKWYLLILSRFLIHEICYFNFFSFPFSLRFIIFRCWLRMFCFIFSVCHISCIECCGRLSCSAYYLFSFANENGKNNKSFLRLYISVYILYLITVKLAVSRKICAHCSWEQNCCNNNSQWRFLCGAAIDRNMKSER